MSNLIKRLREHGKLFAICSGYSVDETIYGEAADLIEQQQKRITELEAQVPKWISVDERLPDVLEVRIKLADGSEVNCWAQSDGDFYWKGGGSEMFILEHQVTHWMPLKEKDNE